MRGPSRDPGTPDADAGGRFGATTRLGNVFQCGVVPVVGLLRHVERIRKQLCEPAKDVAGVRAPPYAVDPPTTTVGPPSTTDGTGAQAGAGASGSDALSTSYRDGVNLFTTPHIT